MKTNQHKWIAGQAADSDPGRKKDGAHYRREVNKAAKRSEQNCMRWRFGPPFPPPHGVPAEGSPQLDQALALAIHAGDAALTRELLSAGATFEVGAWPWHRQAFSFYPPNLSVASAIATGRMNVAFEMVEWACSMEASAHVWAEIATLLFAVADELRLAIELLQSQGMENHASLTGSHNLSETPESALLAEVVEAAVRLIARMPEASLLPTAAPRLVHAGSGSLLARAPTPEIIRALIHRGMDVDSSAGCQDGATPLSCAIAARRRLVVRALLEAGARIEFAHREMDAIEYARMLESPGFAHNAHLSRGSMSSFVAACVADIEKRSLAGIFEPTHMERPRAGSRRRL
jgi:hypothetical protein